MLSLIKHVERESLHREVTEDKVLKILCKLNLSKATGLDQLSPRFVKDGAKLIVSPLTHFLNLSFKIG